MPLSKIQGQTYTIDYLVVAGGGGGTGQSETPGGAGGGAGGHVMVDSHQIQSGTSNTVTIDVENGLSVMEGAVQNEIQGIDADCGGSMACATCHVYVKDEWFNKIPKAEDAEVDMIDMAHEPKKNSRLSCQIIVSDELDGLIVNIPSKQG